MFRFILIFGFSLFASATVVQAGCSMLWQQTFPTGQRTFDGIHVVEVRGAKIYAMVEQTEGEVLLVGLGLEGVETSQVIGLEPNRAAALVPQTDGVILFDGHTFIVRVEAGPGGKALWQVNLLKPPIAAHINAVAAAEDGTVFVAGAEYAGVKEPAEAVAAKLTSDGRVVWRWRSSDWLQARQAVVTPEGGVVLVAGAPDGKDWLVLLSHDGGEVARMEVVGTVLEIRRRSNELALLSDNQNNLIFSSYNLAAGYSQISHFILPRRARTTELRDDGNGWVVSGSWPGDRMHSPGEVAPEAWFWSANRRRDDLPLYRPRFLSDSRVVGIRGSRIDLC
ncbi:MAG: hypothetical protein K2X44_06175 [Magnetospirillum sp.]|nr:hypothetical protein [Magnetospirillum sp.]